MIEQLIKKIKSLKGTTLILTHHNADIDAAASAVALQAGLKQLNISTEIGVAESVARPARAICEGVDILIDPDCSRFDNIILIETSVPEQLTTVKNLRADIIIDHHPPGKLVEQAKITWIEPDQKSTAQMIFTLLKELGCTITTDIARTVAAGLVADTAHLRLAELREFEILTELLHTGIKFEDVLALITSPPDPSEAIACLKAASRMAIYKIGELIVVISKVISHEAAAARSLVRMGADIAIVAAVKESELRISSRAKDSILKFNIDLSEIFKAIGPIIAGSGGGHNLAGSANGSKTGATEDAFKFILKEISKKVGKQYKVL